MSKWTAGQEAVLFENGHRGAEYCAKIIARRFGVYRSVEATQRHASRIGAPMIIHFTCPSCGRLVRKLNKYTGLCEACNSWQLAERWKGIRSEIERGDDDEVSEARKAYNAERQRVKRLQKGGYGNYVDMSRKMSRPRSEAQKILRHSA